MTGVQTFDVAAEDADLRLDRWFKRHFPLLSHARLERLLRTGQVRVDGSRARSNLRLVPGQRIRVPPIDEMPAAEARPVRAAPHVSDRDARALERAVLYRDDEILAIDKPPGLAVQGGTNTDRHLDAMLDVLRFGAAERPRLVHRLDRDTSGVLLLARNAAAAARLAEAFRGKRIRKLYWAAVVGVPKVARGRIDLPLGKRAGRGGERVGPDEEGKRAVTCYQILGHAGRRAAWLGLMPITGRTHQLRAHCAAIGTPILGDGKYGGAAAFLPGERLARQLHLHARAIELPRPGAHALRIVAPLPQHMTATWRFFGFEVAENGNDFAVLDD